MGHQASKNSIHKANSLNNSNFNFVNSSDSNMKMDKENQKQGDVLTKFTWKYGGNQVLLTGSFNRWKQTMPLEKQGDQFSVIINLPRGIHQYKFIVDGEWRFSPEDPSIPDSNGNINNYTDTSNYHAMIDHTLNKAEEIVNTYAETNPETPSQRFEEFAKTCPKLPQQYEKCSFLIRRTHHGENMENYGMENRSHQMEIEHQNQFKRFQESLNESDIRDLFDSSHCLPPPYHVEVSDHVIRQQASGYSALCMTQRFKSKYATYRLFSIDESQMKV